jgi:hypothetical protein
MTTPQRRLPISPLANAPATQGQTPGLGSAMTLGQQMYTTGGGLLGAPVAGNGFNQVNMQGGANRPMYQGATNGVGQVDLNSGANRPMYQGATNGTNQNFGPVAGNGFGQVQYNEPSFGQQNPYLQQMAGNVRNRTNDMLGDALSGIRGQSVASGGLGGGRQGVAQGVALSKGADYLSGNLSNMFGQAYQSDRADATQRYGMDQNFYQGQRGQDIAREGQQQNFYQGQRGQDIQRFGQNLDSWNMGQNRNLQQYGMDQNFYGQQRGQDIARFGQNLDSWNQGQNRDLQQLQGNQNFYTAQRGQDLAQTGLGGSLVQQGLNTQWLPIQNATNAYAPFSGMGSTTNSTQSGGGWQGAVGGGLGVLGLGSQMGWW